MNELYSFIIGLLTAVVLFVVIGVSIFIGFKLANKNKSISTTKPIENLSEKEQREIERLENLQKEFIQVMTYDVNKALEGKKV